MPPTKRCIRYTFYGTVFMIRMDRWACPRGAQNASPQRCIRYTFFMTLLRHQNTRTHTRAPNGARGSNDGAPSSKLKNNKYASRPRCIRYTFYIAFTIKMATQTSPRMGHTVDLNPDIFFVK